MSDDYQKWRNEIKTGDLLMWSHRGWGSWHDFKVQMVRFFTQSEYSHVGVAVWLGERLMVVEAVTPYARLWPLSRSGSFYWVPLNIDKTQELTDAALASLGTEYSQLLAIKAFFTEVKHGETTECAALVIELAKCAGIDLGNRATPDAVVLAAQQRGGATYFIEQAK